jgi:hypothetical protein
VNSCLSAYVYSYRGLSYFGVWLVLLFLVSVQYGALVC